ncbi:MAG: hypothetical protein ABIR24_11575 [Verrucomicrobiota bacterium]
MPKRNIALILLLLALGVIYVFKFTSVFEKSSIQIISSVRPKIGRGKKTMENAVTFSLDNKYELTSLKVIEEREFKTNKYPHAIWHLISESNSEPTNLIIYGIPVNGMKPEVAKVKPEPLQPKVSYVLLLEAGKLKGQTTFQAH